MRERTRRELIRIALAGGTAAFGAGISQVGEAGAAGGEVLDGAHGDPALIARLAQIEQLSAAAYEHVLAAGSLSQQSAGIVKEFLAHERAHVRLLGAETARLGGSPPTAPRDVGAANRALARLGVPGSLTELKDEGSALHYLIGVETVAEGAYYQASSKLTEIRLLLLGARVLGCQAQHWTALSGLLHAGDVYRAVPYPVVLG